ncbi:alpha/beta fold hydrolase [Streptomyces shenzhenensis]|uniref:alpha/beta fold hydrolase n=1 Tax=Streptomyces shenzhenensis TaxID=943815 RepID=UPI0033E6671C
MSRHPLQYIRAGVLDIAFERHGTPGAPPVVLLHGFPYDVRSYDVVATRLAGQGADVVVPYLRGFGPTRFAGATTMRSGQQAALAADLLALLGALRLAPAVVAGYDWGGRAATLTAMLHPDRVAGLVSVDGYNVQDIAEGATPIAPDDERRLWYQYYLHGERGRAGLERNRAALARLLWSEWSPGWAFTDADFAATAPSFDNPDFVAVVVHSYRHRFGLVPGDPLYQADEDRIAARPRVEVPTITISPLRDGLRNPKTPETHAERFPRLVDDLRLPVGHNPPQEAPEEFAAAVARLRLTVRRR